MNENRELIQKADLALSDLTSNGELVPKQAARFLKIAIKKNVLTSRVRVPVMTNPEEEHPKMLWTGRVLKRGQSGTALGLGDRSKPTFDNVTLTSKLYKGEVHMDEEVLEDQIERGTFQSSLTAFMAERISGDLEDILLKSDTGATEDVLTLQDGLVALATTNTETTGGALSGDILSGLLLAMPEEFEDQPNMAFYTNRKARSDYRDGLRQRGTAVGDGIYTGSTPKSLGYDGVDLIKVPRMPNNLGAGTDETVVLYFNPMNAIFGFQRRIKVRSEVRISEGVWVAVVTCRAAIQYEHEPMVAIATGITGQ